MSKKLTQKDTQFKKVDSLKPDEFLQIGQYKKFAGKKGLSRLLHKIDSPTFLHGKNVDRRFVNAHKQKRNGLMIPSEPQQAKMVLPLVASRHIHALSSIIKHTVKERAKNKIDLQVVKE